MKRSTAIGLAAVLIALVIGAAVFMAVSSVGAGRSDGDSQGEQVHQEDIATILFNGDEYRYKQKLETTLFIGLDGVQEEQELSYNNQVQSDYVTLIVMDKAKQSFNVLQLNRDTICDIPVLDMQGNEAYTETAQLALAHTYGSGGNDSCRNVAKTVQNLLYGINIDHYFSISINSISVLNDIVGGVEVTLEDDFSFADPEMVKGETLTLHGEQAEIFVRSRKEMDDSTNIARMKRQKVYMTEWTKTAKSEFDKNQDILMDGLLEISDDLVSDMSIYALADLIEQATSYKLDAIVSPEGAARKKGENMAFYVDEDKLQELVVDVFYEKL